MNTARRSGAAPAQGRPPVVVTFDEGGEVLDVVGDIDWFVAGDDTRQDLYRRLQNLHAPFPWLGALSHGGGGCRRLGRGLYAGIACLFVLHGSACKDVIN